MKKAKYRFAIIDSKNNILGLIADISEEAAYAKAVKKFGEEVSIQVESKLVCKYQPVNAIRKKRTAKQSNVQEQTQNSDQYLGSGNQGRMTNPFVD